MPSDSGTRSVAIDRFFTSPALHPYDTVEWEQRDAVITNFSSGGEAFRQDGVEFPATWSLNATNIVAQKYFRVCDGTKEHSLRQVIDRIAGTIADWGIEEDYFFSSDEAETFRNELKFLMLHQYAAFNSPVWFNIGVPGARQQCSACYILDVDDTMEAILDWYKEEGIIFKGGSGAGINLSKLRSSQERLSGGGYPSGPVSFMRGADASAGTIKSGGTCLAPWTKVYTAEKGAIAVSDLAQTGQDFSVLSYSPQKGRFQATNARAFASGRKSLVTLTTDKGVFTVTPDHPVRLVTGEYVQACNLTFGMSILPVAIDYNTNGYLRVGLRDGKKGRQLLHQLVAQDLLGVDPEDDVHIHHAQDLPDGGHDRLRNGPTDLHVLTGTEHHRLHTQELMDAGIHPFQQFGPTRPDISGDRNGMSATAKASRGSEWSQIAHRNWLDGMHQADVFRSGQDAAARQRMINLAYRIVNSGGSIETFDAYYQSRTSLVGKIALSRRQQLARIEERFGSYEIFLSEVRSQNHKVIAVEPCANGALHDVYDVEVDDPSPADRSSQDGHNFVIWSDSANSPHVGTGIVVHNTRRAAKMVLLDVNHPDIEEFINCKVIEEHKARALRDAGFDMGIDGKDVNSVQYQNANNSVRVTDEFMQAVIDDGIWHLRAIKTGETLKTVRARDIMRQIASAAWECADPGIQYDTTINRWHTSPARGRINASNPCSEYVSNNNTSCNLASLNLLNFLDPTGKFDTVAFQQAVRVVFLAQDILVSRGEAPTEKIAEGTKAHRQIGLGYANLGALLMSVGLPYDSEAGRSLTAAITSLMTATAYLASTEIAARLGSYPAYSEGENAAQTVRVLGMHADAAMQLAGQTNGDQTGYIAKTASAIWRNVVSNAVQNGVRNSQATLLAPTGTISFAMDCDTTGIEPDFSLVKHKTLVGGGTMKIVNNSVPAALANLGYTRDAIQQICGYITDHGGVAGCTVLRPEHADVFACAVGEPVIDAMGHVKMVAAVQPFLSGAVSKTVNVPNTATVDDLYELYVEAWRLGVKCLSVYRDGCKAYQPLNTKDEAPKESAAVVVASPAPPRRKMPRRCASVTVRFRVADAKGYMTVGVFPDGVPGEVFIKMAKQGSTLAGFLDAFAIQFSHSLQYGEPLGVIVKAHLNHRFEPNGFTDDPDIRTCTSIIDYCVRRLAIDYMPVDERAELGVFTTAEKSSGSLDVEDPPLGGPVVDEDVVGVPITTRRVVDFRETTGALCTQCGGRLVRAGSCMCCDSCGSTSGCS